MSKDIRVLIIEDDPYARDLMALLLARDWRTRVVGEVANQADVRRFFAQPEQGVEIIIIDTEMPWDQGWLPEILDSVVSSSPTSRVLFTGTRGDQDILERALRNGWSCGYVLKHEILYALATAVVVAARGRWVITPAIQRIAAVRRIALPQETTILDGTRNVTHLSRRESEVARLGILFNLAQRDLADELVLSVEWISKITRAAYEKLGLRAILSGEASLDAYLEDENIIERYRTAIRKTGTRPDLSLRKAPWLATLAFHLLTAPETSLPE